MSACQVLPIEINPQPTKHRTVAELFDRVDAKLTARIEQAARKKKTKIVEGDSPAFWERTALRTAFRHLSKMFGRPLLLIDVEEILDLTTEDYEVKLEVKHRRAIWHMCMGNRMLKYAAEDGWWTCKAWQRRQAWLPIRKALEIALDKDGNVKAERSSAGCQGIVSFADRNGWWPHTFCPEAMNAWIAWMLSDHRNCSIVTVEGEEMQFRKKLRRADLQYLLPNFDLDSQQATRYYLPLDRMTPELRLEILGIIDWKLKSGPRKFRICEVSADGLLYLLLEFCGFVAHYKMVCGITSLLQIITEEIITDYVRWSKQDREQLPESIRSQLNDIRALINQECPPFAGKKKEFGWLWMIIQRMPREDKNELLKRKNAKSRPYSDLAKIGRGLLADFKRVKAVDEKKAARLFHDYTFIEALRRHPWRLRNWSSARGKNDIRPNITLMEVPRRIQRDGKLPAKFKRALKKDSHRKYLIGRFTEPETKNRHEVFEILDTDLVKTFKEFDVQRRILVGEGPKTIFVNNVNDSKQGPGPMSKNAMAKLLAKLSVRYLGLEKRLSFHICRDIVTEHKLVHGATFEDIQRALWQVSPKSTQRYLSGVNASHGTAVLEREFSRRARARN